MADAKRKRGRPKGSGIDDAQILEQMAAMMLADPGLTRTTALKAIGIDNPSTQRRIRDKFATDGKKLLSSARRSGVTPGKPVAKKPAAKKSAPAKKAIAPKAAAPKAAAPKVASKKAAPAKKAAAKKAPAQKAASKTAMKATAAKKAPAKKVAAKAAPRKAAAKAAPAKRPAAKKAAAKKAGGKKASKARPGSFAPQSSGPPGLQVTAKQDSSLTSPGGVSKDPFKSAMDAAFKAGAPAATAVAKELAEMAKKGAKLGGVGSSIEAVVSNVVEQQIQLYEAAVKHSPVAALLRQQALVTDMMLTMLKAQKEWARSTK